MKFSGNFFRLEIIFIFYERKVNPHLLLELLIDMKAHFREDWTQEYAFRFESLLETLLEDYHNHCGFPCRSWSHQSLLSLWRESRGVSEEERRHLREEHEEFQPELMADPNNNPGVLVDQPELNNNIEPWLVVNDSE